MDFVRLSKLFDYFRSDWGMESLQNPVKQAAKPKPPRGEGQQLEDIMKALEYPVYFDKLSDLMKDAWQFHFDDLGAYFELNYDRLNISMAGSVDDGTEFG